MTHLDSQFQAAVAAVQNAPDDGPFTPSNELKLKLYALYKQATEGDVRGSKPGLLDLVGRAKYGAWKDLRGTSTEEAQRQYIAEVGRVQEALAESAD